MQLRYRYRSLNPMFLALFLTVTLFAFLFVIRGVDPVGAVDDSDHRIVTTGHAEIRVVPDMATVVIGVETKGKTAEEVQGQASERLSKVVEALHKLGIKEKAIQTRNTHVGPEYNYLEGNRVLVGYTAAYDLSITVSELDSLGPVIDSAIKAGATVVNSVQFTVKDAAKYQLSAMQSAVENARQKAQALAEAAGVQGLKIVKIHDQSARILPQAADSVTAFNVMRAEKALPIMPGETSVTADVEVEFLF